MNSRELTRELTKKMLNFMQLFNQPGGMIFSGLGDWKRVSMRRSKMYNNTIYYTSTSRAPIVTMTDHKDGITRQVEAQI